MNIKKLFIGFVTTFAVVLVVNAIVVYLWNLISSSFSKIVKIPSKADFRLGLNVLVNTN